MPAMLKGYIDRVWNNGFAYGSRKLHHKHALWIGLAAAPEDHFQKRNYDQMMVHYLNVGISSYVGIDDSRVEFLYETLAQNSAHIEQLLDRAYHMGLQYGRKESLHV